MVQCRGPFVFSPVVVRLPVPLYSSVVRWPLPLALVVWGVLGPDPGYALADWQVRRASPGVSRRLDPARGIGSEDGVNAAPNLRGLTKDQVAATIERFRKAAAGRLQHFPSQLAFARLLLGAERWMEAAEQFGVAIALEPASMAARRGRGLALSRAGHPREALADLRAALAMTKDDADRLVLARDMIDAATSSNDNGAEIEGREIWARLRPGPESAASLGAAFAHAGRFRDAAATLAAAAPAVKSLESRARWSLEEGRYWAAADDLERASLALGRARKSAPRGATGLRREVFVALLDVARRRRSLDGLARELREPRDVVEWEAKAAVASERGDSRAAWQFLNEALRRRPGDLVLHRRRIAAARRVATADEMARLLESLAITAERTGDVSGVSEALDGLWRLGRQDLAGRAFDRLMGAGRRHPELIRVAAELAGRWGDEQRAERGWNTLLLRNPRDESAIIALGEVRLQRGDRRGALEIWRRMLRTMSVPAEAHARLAETMADHELAEPAVAEARAAIALAPREARYWRVLAGILERQSKRIEAEEAWETVLRMGRGAGAVGERREARTHLVTLWIRDGSARVATKLAQLEEYLRGQPDDEDVRMCLVEAYLRTERIEAAARLLKEAWDGYKESGGDAPVDLVFMLIRSLRQRHRSGEAMAWLEAVSTRFPARAREARLQLADMALAEHDDERAAAFASAAVAADPDDVVVALRAAAIQERMGDLPAATKSYRRAIDVAADPAGSVALAALMARTGSDAPEQRELLRRALLRGTDDDLLIEAGRRAVVLEEALGSLDELAVLLADTADLNVDRLGGGARRRVLANVLVRLVPGTYRMQDREPSAAARLRRYGRDGVRPVLDLAASEGASDVAAIDTLGMLGRAEVTAELVRLLIADERSADGTSHEGDGPFRMAPSVQLRPSNGDVARAIVIALGRLGGDAARTALESVARVQHPALTVPLLWSLGRVRSSVGTELAGREIARSSTDAALVACLTLGRGGGRDAVTILTDVAADAGRSPSLRAAAVLGLLLGRHAVAIPSLRQVARAADGLVGEVSRAGVKMLEAPGATPIPDDATLIPGSAINPPALIRDLTEIVVGRYAAVEGAAP